jgi:hypothetical protein
LFLQRPYLLQLLSANDYLVELDARLFSVPTEDARSARLFKHPLLLSKLKRTVIFTLRFKMRPETSLA